MGKKRFDVAPLQIDRQKIFFPGESPSKLFDHDREEEESGEIKEREKERTEKEKRRTWSEDESDWSS